VWQRRFWEHVIRAKLYIAAVRYKPDIKAQYERLTKKGKTKMSALGAAMRKLVQICFGVLKHQSLSTTNDLNVACD
jgi:transposase